MGCTGHLLWLNKAAAMKLIDSDSLHLGLRVDGDRMPLAVKVDGTGRMLLRLSLATVCGCQCVMPLAVMPPPASAPGQSDSESP